MAVFSDVILDNKILLAGLEGSYTRRNSRVPVASGHTYVNALWDQTKLEFDLGFIPLLGIDWKYVKTLHEITGAGADGFLMEDPTDSRVDSGEGVAYALTSTTFQLYKRYLHAASGRYSDRRLSRIDASTFTLGGALAGTLDPDTAIVTIPSAPAASAVTWTAGRFYVPVRFKDDFIKWKLVGSGQTQDARFTQGMSVILEEYPE